MLAHGVFGAKLSAFWTLGPSAWISGPQFGTNLFCSCLHAQSPKDKILKCDHKKLWHID